MATRRLTVAGCRGQIESASPTNLYDLLGARPDDDAQGLKNAFRKAVKASHPDLHPGDANAHVRLSGIVRAYAILRDRQERASYDLALGFTRQPLRPKPKRTVFQTMHNILSEAVAIVVLAVVLGGGYALLADALRTSVNAEKSVEVAAQGPARIATTQPAARTGTTGGEEPRDKLEGVEVANIAIAPSAVASAANSDDALGIANGGPVPSLPKRDAEVAKSIDDFGAPIEEFYAKTTTNNLKESYGITPLDQNQNTARTDVVELSSPENDKGAPKSAAPGFSTFDQKPHATTPDLKTRDTRTPDTKISGLAAHGKAGTVMVRQTLNHAPFKQAALENKSTLACADTQSCPSRVSPLLGVGF